MTWKQDIIRGIISAFAGITVASWDFKLFGLGPNDYPYIQLTMACLFTLAIIYRSYEWFPEGKSIRLNKEVGDFTQTKRRNKSK